MINENEGRDQIERETMFDIYIRGLTGKNILSLAYDALGVEMTMVQTNL